MIRDFGGVWIRSGLVLLKPISASWKNLIILNNQTSSLDFLKLEPHFEYFDDLADLVRKKILVPKTMVVVMKTPIS